MNLSFDYTTTTIVKDGEALHRITLKDCSTFEQMLRRVVREEINTALPDQIITTTQAKNILGKAHASTITRMVHAGTFTNYATGKQRPKLSLKEVQAHKLKKGA